MEDDTVFMDPKERRASAKNDMGGGCSKLLLSLAYRQEGMSVRKKKNE